MRVESPRFAGDSTAEAVTLNAKIGNSTYFKLGINTDAEDSVWLHNLKCLSHNATSFEKK